MSLQYRNAAFPSPEGSVVFMSWKGHMKTKKKSGVSPERRRYLQRLINRMKLSKKVKDILLEIALEIEGAWVDYTSKLKLDLVAWESLFLDRPEDRIWHASDKTWWRRLTPEEAKKGGFPKWHLVAADPPPAIKQVMDAVAGLKPPAPSWKHVTKEAKKGELLSELVFSYVKSASTKHVSSDKSSKKSKR